MAKGNAKIKASINEKWEVSYEEKNNFIIIGGSYGVFFDGLWWKFGEGGRVF